MIERLHAIEVLGTDVLVQLAINEYGRTIASPQEVRRFIVDMAAKHDIEVTLGLCHELAIVVTHVLYGGIRATRRGN